MEYKRQKENRANSLKIKDLHGFSMVAEVGFEPHDLRVMSPTSYQAALLRDIDFFRRCGAGDRGRTGTILSYHGILSPGRLPVPPHRRVAVSRLPKYYSTMAGNCQHLSVSFLKKFSSMFANYYYFS